MKPLAALFLICLLSPHLALANEATQPKTKPISKEERQKHEERRKRQELIEKLSDEKGIEPGIVETVFSDDRLELYRASAPQPQPPPEPKPKTPQKNPFLSERFGLLTDESLERCRTFYIENKEIFDDAETEYGVPKETICGHLRIETNFGIATAKSPHPFGRHPAVNYLYSLYVLNPRLRRFAYGELRAFFQIADRNGWTEDDIFETLGSPTGAVGLPQFEPSSFNVAVDGNNDGKIDLFDPKDAVPSVASYLVSRGYDDNPERQARAIERYYGIPKKKQKHPTYVYYREAVQKYAEVEKEYLKAHPLPIEWELLIF